MLCNCYITVSMQSRSFVMNEVKHTFKAQNKEYRFDFDYI